MRRWLGRVGAGALLTILVLVGVVARGATLAIGWSAAPRGAAPVVDGPNPVGMRALTLGGLDAFLWYPARPGDRSSGITYAYGMKAFGPGPVALATYAGAATPEAPADVARGPYPLVVLSPGFAIGATSYAWLAERLAANRMVVVAPEHVETLDPTELWRATVERPRDVVTVLDALEDAAHSGLVDTERVAVIGHSYGGYTALAAAGARIDSDRLAEICEAAYASGDPVTFLCDALLPNVDAMASAAGLSAVPHGPWPSWGTERVSAIVALAGDAIMFGEAGLAPIEVPLMTIGGTADVDAPFAWGTRMAYEHASSQRKVEIGLEGAEHLVFTGPCEASRRFLRILTEPFCADPAWERARAHDIVATFVTAFLRAELAGDTDAARVLDPDGVAIPNLTYRAQGYGH